MRRKGLIQGLAWVSDRKGLPKSNDDAEEDFKLSEEWQAYLKRYRRPTWSSSS